MNTNRFSKKPRKRQNYYRQINSSEPDELKLTQSWSVREREFLSDLVSFLQSDGPIKWEQVQQFFPTRSRIQIKSYYHNHLKTMSNAGIPSQICALQTVQEQWFFFYFCVSGFNIDQLKVYYPYADYELLNVRYNEARLLSERILGCVPFIFSYPDTKIDFKPSILAEIEALFNFVDKKRLQIQQKIERLDQSHKNNAIQLQTMFSKEKCRTGLNQIAAIRRDLDRAQIIHSNELE